LKQNTDVSFLVLREKGKTDLTLVQFCTEVTQGSTKERLAKKAGISPRNMAYLIAVYKNRADLFTRVLEGSYTIGKAHAEMKREIYLILSRKTAKNHVNKRKVPAYIV
jgi:hypothetical protein